MQKRIFTLVLVVIIGVFIGVGVIKRQVREPLLRELLQKQDTILEIQSEMNKIFHNLLAQRKGSNKELDELSEKQKALEVRMSALESQWGSLKGILRQANQKIEAGLQAPQAPSPEDFSKIYDIAVAHSPVRGSKKVPVTIVEFVDFQCPFCARFHPPIAEVLEAYPKEVNYVLKNFPLSFHQQAKPAAKAAFAAGEQGKYWEMADLLLANGRSLNEEKFKEFAGNLGLDVKKFMDDYKNKDEKWEQYIQKDITLAQEVNVRGTPTFYINGRKTNARDFNSLKAEIDKILNERK